MEQGPQVSGVAPWASCIKRFVGVGVFQVVLILFQTAVRKRQTFHNVNANIKRKIEGVQEY